jgi:hypothetical protein
MDCNLDLEKVAEAISTMKTTDASTAIGCAVIDAAETASHMFRGSLGLDITGLVIERIGIAKAGAARKVRQESATVIEALREKAKVVAGLNTPKRRGRPPRKETDNA